LVDIVSLLKYYSLGAKRLVLWLKFKRNIKGRTC